MKEGYGAYTSSIQWSIEFMNTGTGKQVQLPLGAIYFDGTTIKAEGDVYNANKAVVDSWIVYLAKAGLLTADTDPPVKPAMRITAKDAGSNGNLIQVTVEKVVPDLTTPANTKFDMIVTEIDIYKGLKPNTIQTVIGDAAGKGSQPGLVFVPGPLPTDLPKEITDAPLAGAPATLALAKNTGAGNAFSVQAKGSGTDGAFTSVTISDVSAAAGTFTLSVKWTKPAPGIKVADLAGAFAYELTVSASDSGVLGPPTAGTFTLTGGSDGVTLPAVQAAALLGGS